MCVSTFIYGMGTLACALTSLSLYPPPPTPIAHRNVRSSKKNLSSNKSSDFFFASPFLASVVNAGDVSETLSVSFGSCEFPPRETTLYRERFDENRRITLKQHIETAKIRFRLQKNVGKATESKILNPNEMGAGSEIG